MHQSQSAFLAFSLACAVLAGCGGGAGSGGSLRVNSKVFADGDGSYPTGSMVRIEVHSSGPRAYESGTIQVTSESQSYDSGVKDLTVADDALYDWDTTGLAPASDYSVAINLSAPKGTIADLLHTIKLEPNPPTIRSLVKELDMWATGPRLPVRVLRTYLLDSDYDGPMGYGWTHTYLTQVIESPTGVVKVFNTDGTGSFFWPGSGGSYVPPPGDYRTLTKLPDNTFELGTSGGVLFKFDVSGLLESVSDRNANSLVVARDTEGNMQAITDSAGQTVTFAYGNQGRISTITGPLGKVVGYSYDAAGNLVSVHTPGGLTTTYSYDVNHNMTRSTDPSGRAVLFEINVNDQLASISREGNQNKLTFAYGIPSHDQLTISDSLGNQTVIQYDLFASVTKLTDPVGNIRRFSYDDRTNLVAATDANGGQSAFVYDAKGRVIRASDPAGNAVTATYNATFGEIETLTDAKGNTTTFSYDSNGNLTAVGYPGPGGSETITYGPKGEMLSRTDRSGRTMAFSYDSIGRIVSRLLHDGTSDVMTYDAFGNLTTVTDENGVLTHTYDSAHRISSVTYPTGDVVAYSYDETGSKTQITYPDGTVVYYDYDSVGRPFRVRDGAGEIANYAYDSMSRIMQRNLSNGVSTSYSFDAAYRLLDLTSRDAQSAVLSKFTYTYDPVGNRVTKTTPFGTTRYSYDGLNQLVDVMRPSGASVAYSFDPAGNRTQVTSGAKVTAYSANASNQYTQVGGATYTFDSNGNVASKVTAVGTTTYSYDTLDQLVAVNTPSETVTYAYDTFGRVSSRTDSKGVTHYVYDGFHVIMERDGTGAVTAKYVYGVWVDELLQMTRGGKDYLFLHDGMRTVTEITDSSGAVVESYDYQPYGKPRAPSSVGNPYLFVGRTYDAVSELYDFRARYYDPGIGRFLSPDPSRYGDGANLYVYAGNNPVRFTDPSGRAIVIPLWIYQAGNAALRCAASPACRGFFVGLACSWNNCAPSVPSNWGEFLGGQVAPTVGWGGSAIGEMFENLPANPDPNDPFGPSGCIDMGVIVCDYSGMFGEPGDEDGSNSGGGGLSAGDPSFIQVFDRRLALAALSKPETPARGLEARIAVPYPRSIVRANVPVIGSARGEGFAEYRLEYGRGADPESWIRIARSDVPALMDFGPGDLNESFEHTVLGNLGNWDTGLRNYEYPPMYSADHEIDLKGTYTLRLVVVGRDGSTAEDRVTVDVGNVVPNAWGGNATSEDGLVRLAVQEQALLSAFRLFCIRAEDGADAPETPEGSIGHVYSIREPGEIFTRRASLIMALPESWERPPDAIVSVHAWDPSTQRWQAQATSWDEQAGGFASELWDLSPYYVLALVSTEVPAQLEAEVATVASTRSPRDGAFHVSDTFEYGAGEWTGRGGAFGAYLEIEDSSALDGTRCLRIGNPRDGGNFATTAVSSPFDVRTHSIVEFDYRATQGLKCDLYVKVNGGWYVVGFTDDYKETRYRRVNLANIGAIEAVVDGEWHTARFDLSRMLLTQTRETLVEEIVIADWDVTGFMKLAPGKSSADATLHIDNFTIGRDDSRGLRFPDASLVVDDFDSPSDTNALDQGVAVYTDSMDTRLDLELGEAEGRTWLAMTYDGNSEGAFACYVTDLGGIDLTEHAGVYLTVNAGAEALSKSRLGLADASGTESKLPIDRYVQPGHEAWKQIVVPLAAFGDELDLTSADKLVLAFEGSGQAMRMLLDRIEFQKTVAELRIADFEAGEHNLLGQPSRTYLAGNTTIQARRHDGDPSRILALSFGGDIGELSSFEHGMGFAGWATGLGGIDASSFSFLELRIRGSKGGEEASLYLDDGNERWGMRISKVAELTDSWQLVRIPLEDFAQGGVDLTHLLELQIVFEWQRMSGTVCVDDFALRAE